MKKIINGKVYDTATAQCVGEWSNGYTKRDWKWQEESLYRKRTGEFFLHGEGGPLSLYANIVGRTRETGERIFPLTWEEAQEWAEEKLSADEYEEIFGEVTEDETRQTLTLSLSAASIERVRRAAAKAGISISAFIETLIDDYHD